MHFKVNISQSIVLKTAPFHIRQIHFKIRDYYLISIDFEKVIFDKIYMILNNNLTFLDEFM